jgi:hypothetical protein
LTDRSISNAEGWAVIAFCMAASTLAILWSWRHGAMLNYGDAVAHLHIARRVFDARTPRFSQLGSVWLPLPHILLIPFVQNYEWWASGLAGVIPSALAYIASCVGIYRLARRWLNPTASALALVFFALNPNLLYLETTAMTEPLFLCEMIWIVVWMVEWRAALDGETQSASYTLRPNSASRLQACIAAALVAAIFTRYDGWIIAFLVWTGIGLTLLRHAAAGGRGRLSSPAFWLATLAVVAAPILWFVYNSVAFGDWLYFARGPFSAKAIELRTSAPGWPPHPGWHNPWVALLYYLKVSLLDAVAAPAWGNAWGNIVLALAAPATAAALFAKTTAARHRASAWILLLWLPVPFYTWSVAYGSVPIFLPAWWPCTWYNTRYGLEMLPALALGLGFAAQSAAHALRRIKLPRIARLSPPIAFALLFALAALNVFLLLRARPIVYVESTKNLEARQPYDDAIPPALQGLLTLYPRAPVLMNTSTYPEIVALTGIPLRQTINESDLQIFYNALAAPAAHAAVVLAFDGDEVDQAVKAHPEGLVAVGHFTAANQPSATLYVSSKWIDRTPAPY